MGIDLSDDRVPQGWEGKLGKEARYRSMNAKGKVAPPQRAADGNHPPGHY